MQEFEFVERKPTAEELFILRESVGWGIGEKEAFENGLKNSLYGVCVFKDEMIIGIVRVIGDGSTCFYIQDVIVKPEYQKMGIGFEMMKKVMKYIEINACSGAVVGLMAAKGKEKFYEKFGFWKRPNENFGHGMMQFWKKAIKEVRKNI
jgi:predicted GNAT family N-acyltransferase